MAEERASRPTLKLLMLKIPTLVQWKRFGTLLDLPYEVMEAIQADCSTTTDCTYTVWSEWLNRSPNASWSKVAECLHDIGQHTLAQHIEREYVYSLTKAFCDSHNGQTQDDSDKQEIPLDSEDKVVLQLRRVLLLFTGLVNSVKRKLRAEQVLVVDVKDFLSEILNKDHTLMSGLSLDGLFDLMRNREWYCFIKFDLLEDLS